MSQLPIKQFWQEALSNLITDPKELLSQLALDPQLLEAAYKAALIFPLKATHSFVGRMERGNPNDPLLRQVLPLGIELMEQSGYGVDPLHEVNVNPVPGLLHKYHGRVLVTLTSACAIHCRYCFRRHFPYTENNPGRSGWEKIVTYIKQNVSIKEVILSGGDPLSTSDTLLKQFSDLLNTLPHVNILRIHTRLPIVLPQRITDDFLRWITQLKQKPVIVLHTNHPNEINSEVCHALTRLHQTGAHLLNQSVLLKGINDDVSTLTRLSERLFAQNVLPYYLHVLDKIQGAAHFDLPLAVAKKIHADLSTQLPGYLLPRLVCEESGLSAKTLLNSLL